MDARNPPRYERGIIITKVVITVLSMPFSSIEDGFEQARRLSRCALPPTPFDHQRGFSVLRFLDDQQAREDFACQAELNKVLSRNPETPVGVRRCIFRT